MTVGERGESIEEKRKRHIKESQDQIDGWKNELQYAISHKDIQYEKYCEFMIKVWENTLEKLNEFQIF